MSEPTNAADGVSGGEDHSQAAAAAVCMHYWSWVSPAGTNKSARICMSCHEPDPEWLNHVVEVDRGHAEGCVHCEFAEATS